jgi:hypothetical protein
MRTLGIFRGLVFGAILLLVLRVLGWVFGPEIPATVTTWLKSEGVGTLIDSLKNGPFSLRLAVGGLLLAYSLAYVASLLGLLRFHAWARYMFILTTLVGIALLAASGMVISSAFQAAAGALGAMIDGALLTLLFVDPVRMRFRGPLPEPALAIATRSDEPADS